MSASCAGQVGRLDQRLGQLAALQPRDGDLGAAEVEADDVGHCGSPVKYSRDGGGLVDEHGDRLGLGHEQRGRRRRVGLGVGPERPRDRRRPWTPRWPGTRPGARAASVGRVIEMRGTNGSSPAWGTPTTSRRRSVSDFWPGNSEAQWPSGPIPSSSRSNLGGARRPRRHLLVVLGALVGTELALHPLKARRPVTERVEQALLDHLVVGAVVLGVDAALVADPERRVARGRCRPRCTASTKCW